MNKNDKAATLRHLTEIGLKIVITGAKGIEPLSAALLKYLENDPEQIREYFKRHQNFDPLIVIINDKTYAFPMRSFIEDPLTPILETTTVIIR